MKRLNRILVAAAAVSCLFAGTLSAAEKQKEARNLENAKRGLEKATMSLGGAVELALKKVPNSKAVEGFLVTEGDDVDYQVEVISNGKHTIVEIDATTGQVEGISDERIEDNPEGENARHELIESEAATAPVWLGQAIESALARFPAGKAFEAEPTKKGGKLSFEIKLLDGNKFRKVTVEGASGAIAHVEDEGST